MVQGAIASEAAFLVFIHEPQRALSYTKAAMDRFPSCFFVPFVVEDFKMLN